MRIPRLASRLRRVAGLVLAASVAAGALVTVTAAPAAAASCSPLRQCIYNTAEAERNNVTRNREGTNNCNYYSGYWGLSWLPTTGCITTDGVRWRQDAWCADFVRYVWAMNGAVTTGLTHQVVSFYNTTVGTSRWKPKSSGYVPQKGDAVLFDWVGNGTTWDHVGIVVSYNSITGYLNTIEGNTTATGNDNDPGGVFARVRSTAEVIGYVTPVAASGPIYE